MTQNKTYTKQDVITAFKKYYEDHGNYPSRIKWVKGHLKPSETTIYLSYGSWGNAFKEVFGDVKKLRIGRKFWKILYTREDIRNAILEYFKKYNKIPTAQKWQKLKCTPTLVIISKHYGTWNNCLLDIFGKINMKEHTKESIMEEMRKYYERNGKKPTYGLWEKGKYRPSFPTINKLFGSWNNCISESFENEEKLKVIS